MQHSPLLVGALATVSCASVLAQVAREPIVYRLPASVSNPSAGACSTRPAGEGPVPSLFYHGRFGHYYYDALAASSAPPDDPKFRIRVFAPVSPLANGRGVVTFASGGFVSHPAYSGCREYEQERRYLAASRELLEAGYTVFVVTHGDALLPSDTDTYPGWIVSEISTQAHHAVRAIKAAYGAYGSGSTNYFAMLPNFPTGAANLDVTHLGAAGSSSGGGLALEVFGRPSVGDVRFSFADAGMSAPANGLLAQAIDSSVYAATVFSTGAGGFDWRFPGDTAFLWTIPRYLFHPDLSQCASVTSVLLAQYPNVPLPVPPGQWNVNLAMLFADACGSATYPEHPFLPAYDPLPGDSKLLLQQLSLYETWTSAGSGTPWPRGSFLELHGTDDLFVPFYQQSLLQSAALVRGVPALLGQRSGEGHGWKDLDGEDAEMVVGFFDRELRGTSDGDGDGIADAAEIGGLQANDADTDGDGQADGDEIAIGTDALDAHSVFRIYDVTQTRASQPLQSCLSGILGGAVTGTAETFFVTLRYETAANAPGTYVLQWTDDLAPAQRTTWYDHGGTCGTLGVPEDASGRRFAVTCKVKCGGNRPVNFLRVRFVPATPALGRPDIVTAPIAQRLVELNRDPGTGRRWNFLAPPVQPRDEVRSDVASVQYPTGTGLGEITFVSFPGKPGAVEDPATPGVPAAYGAVNNTTRYVAVVVRDRSRNPQTVKPEDRGAEGRWWEIDSVVSVNTVRVKPHGSNTTTFLDGLPGGAEVAIRRLSSLADFTGPASDPIRNFCYETGLTGPRNDDRVMTYDRFVHGSAKQYRFLNSTSGWESDAATPLPPGAGCPTTPAPSWSSVQPEEIRLLPDEGFAYWSVHFSDETWCAPIGWLAQSDLVAYLEPEANGSQWPAPAAASCQLGDRRLRGWPFPEGVPVGNLDGGSAVARPDSNLVASGFVLSAGGGFGKAIGTADDVVYIADEAVFAAQNALFAPTNPALLGAGYQILVYPTYTGDAGAVAVSGRIDPATLSAHPELLPLEQTWFVDLATTLPGGASSLLFFVDLFDLVAVHAAIEGHDPITGAQYEGSSFPSVLNDLTLQAGRSYQMRLGNTHPDIFEWLRRRPYRRQ